MELILQDVFEACNHIPEGDSMPHTVLTISMGKIVENEDVDLPLKATIGNASYRFLMTEDYLTVDLIFKDQYDSNLRKVHHLLKTFDKEIMVTDETSDTLPTILFSILPLELRAKYQICVMNPIFYALTAKTPDTHPHIIRMVFEKEDFLLVELEGLHYDQIVADAKRRMDMEDFYAVEEEKKRKREQYEAEMGFNKAKGDYK